MLMLPEIVVIATAFAVLVLDLFMTERSRRFLAPLAMAGLAFATAALFFTPQVGALLGGRFALDPVGWWFKLVFLLAGIVTVALSRDLLDGRALVRMAGMGFRGEYYTILLFTLAGMLYLVSARDLVTLYIALELATVPLFVLAAWRRGGVESGEAGLKYVILGAMASAFILYGLAILYGLGGTTDLVVLGEAFSDGLEPAFWLAAALLVAGIGFKLTLVPFHMWAADVYQGAPTPVTAYLSVASKAAGLAFLFHLFYRILLPAYDGWDMAIALLAALTMTVGNLVAIVQHNIKRFMAFSAVSQAGNLLLGFLGGIDRGVSAMVFYLLVYMVTNLAVFACIVWHSNQTGKERIEDYAGLSRTNPALALALMIGLFSLAGIPPLSGFVGKFFLFSIASQAGFHWLVAVAAVNSTISLYYYLRVVRQMYIEAPADGARPLPVPATLATTVAALTAGVVLLGIVPVFYQAIHVDTIGWIASLVG